jgi:hypothetical protein
MDHVPLSEEYFVCLNVNACINVAIEPGLVPRQQSKQHGMFRETLIFALGKISSSRKEMHCIGRKMNPKTSLQIPKTEIEVRSSAHRCKISSFLFVFKS